MKPAEIEYARLRLESAQETLSEARLLLNSGFLKGTVNRIYYACFYAVNALLFSEGLSSSKHGGVISLFNRYFIKTGRLPGDMGKLYGKIFEMRQEGDYEETTKFDQHEVEDLLSYAQSFIEQIADWLRTNKSV
ncbi:MAG: HEPN domain-containing protein [Armatimonadota bacterium]|nr:HEPN domain-containing protein [Armatimonadota bacterium]